MQLNRVVGEQLTHVPVRSTQKSEHKGLSLPENLQQGVSPKSGSGSADKGICRN